jgi:hypothetical protein
LRVLGSGAGSGSVVVEGSVVVVGVVSVVGSLVVVSVEVDCVDCSCASRQSLR